MNKGKRRRFVYWDCEIAAFSPVAVAPPRSSIRNGLRSFWPIAVFLTNRTTQPASWQGEQQRQGLGHGAKTRCCPCSSMQRKAKLQPQFFYKRKKHAAQGEKENIPIKIGQVYIKIGLEIHFFLFHNNNNLWYNKLHKLLFAKAVPPALRCGGITAQQGRRAYLLITLGK